MLIDMMTGQQITQVPYAREYRTFMSRLAAAEIAAIKQELNAMIEDTEIQTAGWMPGADWTGTPFQPIYEKAARFDQAAAARCFGLMVWDVFMHRPEVWTSGRFEKNGEEIGSRTYFQPRKNKRDTLEAFAAEEYRAGRLTHPELRRLLGYATHAALDEFLKARAVYEPYGVADLERERAELDRLGL